MTEVELMAEHNKQSITAWLRGTPVDQPAASGRSGDTGAGRQRRGAVTDPAASATLRAALGTLSRVPQRSLQDFLA
jgi:hypothetical protein